MTFKIKIERDEDIAALSQKDSLEALNERSEELDKVFKEAGENMDPTTVKSIEVKDGGDLAMQITQRHEEISKVGKRVKMFQDVDAAKRQNDTIRSSLAAYDATDPSKFSPKNVDSDDDGKDGGDKLPEAVSAGEAFVKSDAYKMAKAGLASGLVELKGTSAKRIIEGKALFRENDGFAPETTRIGLVVPIARRPIELLDMMRIFPSNQVAVEYMEQTLLTDAAAERDEAGEYAEGGIRYTERTVPIRNIGIRLPVTDNQLADEPGIRAMIDEEFDVLGSSPTGQPARQRRRGWHQRPRHVQRGGYRCAAEGRGQHPRRDVQGACEGDGNWPLPAKPEHHQSAHLAERQTSQDERRSLHLGSAFRCWSR